AIWTITALTALAGCVSVAPDRSKTPAKAAPSTKVFAILVRKDGLSPEEFRRRWLGHNGQLARRMGGIGGLVLSESFGPGAMVPPTSSYPEPVDGFVQAWFADAAAIETALGSEAGKGWLAEGDEFLNRDSSRIY